MNEDIRQFNQIQDLAQFEYLMDILISEAATLLNVSSLANLIQMAESTVKNWLNILSAFYFNYKIKPWYRNIRRAIRKTSKNYLWDWSQITDRGRRIENFIASHLYKSVHFWTDM